MNDLQLFGLIRGVLLPAAACGGIYLIARLLPGVMRITLRSTGVAVAVAMAFVLLLGIPQWPWFGSPSGVLAAAALVSFSPLLEQSMGRQIWTARLALLAAIAFCVLHPFFIAQWSLADSGKMLLIILSVAGSIWMTVERGSEQMAPVTTIACYIVMAVGAAVTFALEGSASLAQLAGALAAGLGAAFVLGLSPYLQAGRTEINSAVIPLLMALWLAHGFYVDTDWISNAVMLAPLAVFVLRSFVVSKSMSPLKEALFSAGLAAIPVAWFLFQKYQVVLRQ